MLTSTTRNWSDVMAPGTLIEDPPILAADEDTLVGRVALVTGGTRGIGAAISRSLARRGAVVAAGFSSDTIRAADFATTLQLDGADASVHQGNVGDPDDCARVVREVIDQHGRLDVLVNNAGVTVDRPISMMSVDDWHNVLRINLSGAFYMSKPALGHMLERGSGRIINISSVVAETGNVGQANYAASKSGLLGLTKSLAREAALAVAKAGGPEGGIGVTVNAITPGLIETDMTAAIPDKAMARILSAIPIGRIGRPEEVARVVRFLAADSSSYITGQVWAVNGGYDM
jgi:acetoacetyl-CoA reductase/3-oxoacyl-[acyl-carrier protein] reductase